MKSWNPAYWLTSRMKNDTFPCWVIVATDELVEDDAVFYRFQRMMMQPEGWDHLTAVARQMERLWDDIDWKTSDPDETFRRQRAVELWSVLWRNESRLTGNSAHTEHSGRFYQQLRHRLENRWGWNIWVSRYLPMTRDASLWHESACQYLFQRVQFFGPQRPYALTLCWKVLLSTHAPSRHYPLSDTVRKYIQGLSPHLSWATRSDYYVKRFLDWELKPAGQHCLSDVNR